jgi:hypothetical protein
LVEKIKAFRAADGQLFLSLEAAQEHEALTRNQRRAGELCRELNLDRHDNYSAFNVILKLLQAGKCN